MARNELRQQISMWSGEAWHHFVHFWLGLGRIRLNLIICRSASYDRFDLDRKPSVIKGSEEYQVIPDYSRVGNDKNLMHVFVPPEPYRALIPKVRLREKIS